MFENLRRDRQATNFCNKCPKILDLKSSSEQIFVRKLSLGAPEQTTSKEETWSRNTKSRLPFDVNVMFNLFSQ